MDIEKAKPRHNCYDYILRSGGKATLSKKEHFDRLCWTRHSFSDGPHRDSFGDGYGHPENPHRQAFGTLRDGTVIYCEISTEKEALALGGYHSAIEVVLKEPNFVMSK